MQLCMESCRSKSRMRQFNWNTQHIEIHRVPCIATIEKSKVWNLSLTGMLYHALSISRQMGFWMGTWLQAMGRIRRQKDSGQVHRMQRMELRSMADSTPLPLSTQGASTDASRAYKHCKSKPWISIMIMWGSYRVHLDASSTCACSINFFAGQRGDTLPFDHFTMPIDWRKNQDQDGLHNWELLCASKKYKVSKDVVAQNSEVLAGQIQNWDKGQTDLDELTGCASPEVVEMFLNYCYYGTDSQKDSEKLDLKASNTIPFLKFCDALHVLHRDEGLVTKIKATIDCTNIQDAKTAVQVLLDIVNLGPWNAKGQGDKDQLLSQISALEIPCSEVIAHNLDSLAEESQQMLQENCKILSMVLKKAKSCATIGHLIAKHLDHSHCTEPESCFREFAPTILRSIQGFTTEDATMMFKMGIRFQHAKCREAALKVKAMNFTRWTLSQFLKELKEILGVGNGQQDACNILCDLLDRGDLVVRSEDEVLDKILELEQDLLKDEMLQAIVPKDQMLRIWPCCRFAHVSPKRYLQLMPLLKTFKLSQYLNISFMWGRFREVKGDAGLDQFLKSASIAEFDRTVLKNRLSPRKSYDKEVHICEYKAGDPACPGVLRGLGNNFGSTTFRNPVGKEVQISVSRWCSGEPANILELDQFVEIQYGSDGTTWFKIDLGPGKRLKPSHCRFHLYSSWSSCPPFPEFEVKKDDTARSDWLGAELRPNWTAEEQRDGSDWKLMTVSLQPGNQSFQLFQLVLNRGPSYCDYYRVKNLELYGALEIDKQGFGGCIIS